MNGGIDNESDTEQEAELEAEPNALEGRVPEMGKEKELVELAGRIGPVGD